MLNIDYLIKIKRIPRGISQHMLLSFLREVQRLVEGQSVDDVPWLNDQQTVGGWFLRQWFFSGNSFLVGLDRGVPKEFLLPTLGFYSILSRDGFSLYPDVFEATLEQPMILTVNSSEISPADFDQIDLNNALVTCRKLGCFDRDELMEWKYGSFTVSVDDKGVMSIYQVNNDGERKPIWILPEMKSEKEWEW